MFWVFWLCPSCFRQVLHASHRCLLLKGLSEGDTLIEFVTGPSLAREEVENRTKKADLMAEPENLPPSPARLDANTSPPNF
jgi:hypothetical protein